MAIARVVGACLLGAVLAGLPTPSHTSVAGEAAVAAPVDADALADAMLQKIGVEKLVQAMFNQMAPLVVQMLKQSGPTDEQAEEIWTRYMKPEFEAQLPKLVVAFHAILIEDFTRDELQAITDDLHNDARRSAAAKVPHMQQQFQEAGTAWGRQAGMDAYAAHQAEINQLGLKDAQ